MTINYGEHQGQCYVPLPFEELAGRLVRFTDVMGSAIYDRDGGDVRSRGLYLDMPAWGYHAFEVTTR